VAQEALNRIADLYVIEAKAIDYRLKCWTALTRYAETGDLPIDNNPVEKGWANDKAVCLS
jgi:hypothetical protein